MMIDLRSDTVTRPTPAMYAAMQEAPLGDDVLGDDPTVAELEQESARLAGMEAAVFVPSGTMGNQIALACHTQPGDCALFDEEAHMLYYEVGAPGVIAGVVTRTCPSRYGVMDPQEIEKRIQIGSLHTPPTTVICLENTHNRAGGTVVPLSVHQETQELARRYGIAVHLDGARVFNAATALGVELREILQHVDSVSFCLSKALGAPVGSVLCGKAEFIARARRWRKRLGGGMRQSGILAACGLVGLREVFPTLGEDHVLARRVAEDLQSVPGVRVDLDHQATNFVMVETDAPAAEVCERLAQEGVLAMAFGPHRVRCVFHYDVPRDAAPHIVRAFEKAASA